MPAEMTVRGLNWLTGGGRQESRIAKETVPAGHSHSEDCWYSVQTGASLLQTQERLRLIRVLSENSPLSQQVTEAWWLRPLENMAARVQACPAAWNGIYSGPGGFIDLSLNVATRAVRLVRGMMLPPGATPEEQSEQAPGWVCAVYWAGLFHHLRWLTQIEGALKSGRVWFPGLSVPAEPWRIRPDKNSPCEMSGTYMAYSLLPDAGLIWLQRWPALSDSLLKYLSGRCAEAGLLNSIVSEALKSSGVAIPTCLAVNIAPEKPQVQALWEDDHNPPKIYETDVISLSSDTNSQYVSGPFNHSELIYSASQPSAPMPQDTKAEPVIMAMESALAGDDKKSITPDGSETGQEAVAEVSIDNLLAILGQMTEGKSPSSREKVADNISSAGSASLQKPTSLAEHSGEIFLKWMKDSVKDEVVSVNEKDSFLHVLAQFVFLISPTCFYRYATVAGEGGADKDKLQKSFESLGIHHSRNGKGLFHYHQYDTPDKSGRYTKVSGYMISADIIFKKGCCPADSVWLSAKK